MFKSSKLIPTMIVATVMRNNSKPFTGTDYLAALLLCAGTGTCGQHHPYAQPPRVAAHDVAAATCILASDRPQWPLVKLLS